MLTPNMIGMYFKDQPSTQICACMPVYTYIRKKVSHKNP